MDFRQELTAFVISTLQQLAQDKGEKAPDLSENSSLIDGGIGIDSLDLAVVIVRLQEKTGKDPFSQGFVGFSTVRELVNLYAQ
jgi:acyl carrier protein